MTTTHYRYIGLVASLVIVLAQGCATPPDPSSQTGIVPDAQMKLGIENETDRFLELVVNGTSIAALAPFSQRVLTAAELPPLPWHAELRSAGGRKLSEATIVSGSVERHENGGSGVGSRVDLSCGRIDIWSGYPPMGPPPGPGQPGDCDP